MSVPGIGMTPVNRIQSFPIDAQIRCNDKYVISFDFSEIGMFRSLSLFIDWRCSQVAVSEC